MKPFELLDHEADVGIKSWGKTVEEAFENGAKAMFSVMVNLKKVEPVQEITVTAQADDIDGLFVEWLNELLAQKDIAEMVFSDFTVRINKNEEVTLSAKARGELLDQKRHEIKTEVKAATYYGLKSGKENGLHWLQCVLDI